jgi:hypothetical protein
MTALLESPQDNLDPRRRREIFRAWAKSISKATVAEMYGVSVAEVDEIVRAEKSLRPSLEEADGLEVLEDHKIKAEAILEDLAVEASRSQDPRERIAAAKARFAILAHLFEVDREVGILPRNLRYLAEKFEMEAILKKLVEVLRAHDVDEKAWEELAEAFAPPERRIDDRA